MSSDNSPQDEAFCKLMRQYQLAVEKRDFANASNAVHNLFARAEEWCGENPSPDLDLTLLAAECEERADWDAAESAYTQILSLSDLAPDTEFKAHSDLASLCRLLGRNPDALGHARRATSAARRADLSVLLLMALRGEARCLVSCGLLLQASDLIVEALSAIDKDEMYNQMLASFLTLRAECAIHYDAIEEAERDLEQAFRLLEPMTAMHLAAGVHSDLSYWWTITAGLRAKRDDRNASIIAWQNALVSAKHVASLPHSDNVYAKDAVACVLKGLADALLLGDRKDEATRVNDERDVLLSSIGVPDTGAEPP